jgi:osmotically-inducible protein OsmY
MSSFSRIPGLLLCGAILTGVAACAATRTEESAGQYFDDTSITAKAKAAIFNEPSLKSAEINVETFKGVVQLSGFVNSASDIERAKVLVQGISGVRSVQNKMQLK